MCLFQHFAEATYKMVTLSKIIPHAMFLLLHHNIKNVHYFIHVYLKFTLM